MNKEIEVAKLTDQLNRTIKSTDLKEKDLDNLVNHFTKKVNDYGYNLFLDQKVYQFKKFDNESNNFNIIEMETNDINGSVQIQQPMTVDGKEQAENVIAKVIYSDKFKKGYLMTSGTMFTGFMASLIAQSIMKDKPNANKVVAIAFVGGLILGGIYTSKLLK